MKSDEIEIYESYKTHNIIIKGQRIPLWDFYIKSGNITLKYEVNFYQDFFRYFVITPQEYNEELSDSFDVTSSFNSGDPMLDKLVSMFNKEIRKLKLKQILD
jgi:hypothetical protein